MNIPRNAFFDLSGECAIVTGAARGIGRAVAAGLAESGAEVLAVDLNENVLEPPDERLESWHGKTADVSSPGDTAAIVSYCADELGPPGILVNAAAVSSPCSVNDMSFDAWKRILDVNLSSVFLLVKEVLPYMHERGEGSIINFSSMVASTGGKTSAHYSAAKGGVEGFSRSLAAEAGPWGIRVNVVAPGMVDTPMLDLMPESQRGSLVKRIPLQRMGKPEDFAGLCLLLASDAGSYINGQTIHVNGGMFMT